MKCFFKKKFYELSQFYGFLGFTTLSSTSFLMSFFLILYRVPLRSPLIYVIIVPAAKQIITTTIVIINEEKSPSGSSVGIYELEISNKIESFSKSASDPVELDIPIPLKTPSQPLH